MIFCQLHKKSDRPGMTASDAVKLIFQDKLPDFVSFSNILAE
jgi:hypothetical protein